MPGKRAPTTKRSAPAKDRCSASSTSKLKPTLLGLKPPAKLTGSKKKGKAHHKARDADVRDQLDGDREALRAALERPDKNKPLVKKQEAPKELARGGDSLAQSMDQVLDLLGAA